MTDFPSLVSTDWLQENLADPELLVLDGSFKLPGQSPLAHKDYEARHIPQARFFDIEVISDGASQLPHMLPSPEAFASEVRKLGISNDTAVVVYDTPGLMSAARIWWTFRVFGHSRIAVLDGGLKTWMAEGREVTAALPQVTCGTFSASYRP